MIAAGFNGASDCDQLVRICVRELPEKSHFQEYQSNCLDSEKHPHSGRFCYA
jgi:hypothetical protein